MTTEKYPRKQPSKWGWAKFKQALRYFPIHMIKIRWNYNLGNRLMCGGMSKRGLVRIPLILWRRGVTAWRGGRWLYYYSETYILLTTSPFGYSPLQAPPRPSENSCAAVILRCHSERSEESPACFCCQEMLHIRSAWQNDRLILVLGQRGCIKTNKNKSFRRGFSGLSGFHKLIIRIIRWIRV